MSIFAGLDVSDKSTHICVVDAEGGVLRRDVVASDPEALASWLNRHCPDLVRVVLETGPLSTFLYHGLVERGIPVVGIEPSCMLTMRDEYRSLGLGEAAQRVAAGALLLEELLVRDSRRDDQSQEVQRLRRQIEQLSAIDEQLNERKLNGGGQP